jgi:hypothetical protein
MLKRDTEKEGTVGYVRETGTVPWYGRPTLWYPDCDGKGPAVGTSAAYSSSHLFIAYLYISTYLTPSLRQMPAYL